MQLMLARMFAVLIVGFCATVASASEADRLVGRWLTEGDSATIEIYRDGDRYHGRIVALREPLYPEGHSSGLAGQPKRDRNNPDPAKRTQGIVGLALLRDFEYAGELRWENGKIYNPRDGSDYSCEIKLNEDGTLDVRGYVGLPLLGSSQIWRPADG